MQNTLALGPILPLLASLWVLTGSTNLTHQTEPVVIITKDNTRLNKSCIVRIDPNLIIADSDGDGVLHIASDDITITFEAGSRLRGGTGGPGALGIGIRIDGHRGVTLRRAAVSGYKVGVYATGCTALELDGLSAEDNFREQLRSTRTSESETDWLWPHDNDQGQWRTKYGAAVYLERCEEAKVHRVVVRKGQNGIVLDRVNKSVIFDNDCSFLSGWGIAMWRSSGNILSRNACDFCIRGHSEGVYNRGQDSAGFLVFEQCNSNVFIENSATHCGNGFFGFAGKESLGQNAPPHGFDYSRSGCNDNLLVDNDFSYASAHGIEMTFSHRNRFIHNRLVGNGICGIWAGYSNDSVIADNHFEGNGRFAHGSEGGAINIEHGSGNRIDNNRFTNNTVGVSLWWDNDGELLATPGVKAHYRNVTNNIISNNRFEINDGLAVLLPAAKGATAIRLSDRGTQSPTTPTTPTTARVSGNSLIQNVFALTAPGAVELDLLPAEGPLKPTLIAELTLPAIYPTPREPVGETGPVSGRSRLAGTFNMVVGPDGPWDHTTPLVLPVVTSGGIHSFDVFGALPEEVTVTSDQQWSKSNISRPERTRIVLAAEAGQSVTPYEVNISVPPLSQSFKGVLLAAKWQCAAFPWTKDPREDDNKWREDRLKVPQAVATVPAIDFNFGSGGPRTARAFAEMKDVAPGPDRFGMVCVTTLTLPKGRWKFTTVSDDGVRVVTRRDVAGEVVTQKILENWTHHGPTTDSGVLQLDEESEVNIQVEYFEIDGHAMLKLDLAPEPPTQP